jgi:hypothetical protein
MGNRHPNHGPSLTKATYKANRRGPAPSPERQRAELEQAATEASNERRFWQMLHNHPRVWYKEYFKK